MDASKKAEVHVQFSVLREIPLKCDSTWTYVLQTNDVLSNGQSMTSSGYNYCNKTGTLTSIINQTSIIEAVENITYTRPATS